ncbi:MAG: hypothetical protein V8R83_12490 [Candidatus Gastranaerophilaceae bacterium]
MHNVFCLLHGKIGSPIAIPSGKLCIAIAITSGIPSYKSVLATRNIVKPSGNL